MNTLREHISNERRHLREVRQSLSAALEQGSAGDEAYLPFYIAIADYMDVSMGRLHVQDIYMGKKLSEYVSGPDETQAKGMDELHERLAGNQEHLKRFLTARDDLKTKGASAIDAFESVSRAYTNYIVSNMGHHGASTDMAQKHFTQEDWNTMANITDESVAREKELYDNVFAAKPAGLTLPETD